MATVAELSWWLDSELWVRVQVSKNTRRSEELMQITSVEAQSPHVGMVKDILRLRQTGPGSTASVSRERA
ncbi:hypothetical protein TNCV_977691 [Trichonephila clavipes]|nr:hypothetical protein TNCV_977691 [Trichonephila clavipes]